MTLALEDFSSLLTSGPVRHSQQTTAQMEAERSSAYEQGYAAGWEDAAKAESEGQARISTEFARHLQEMSFTFHEARAHVIESVHPLLQGIIDQFLPAVLRDTMGQRILETLVPLAEKAADQPIVIAVSQGSKAALEPILKDVASADIELMEEPSLTDGQAYLRLGNVERKIDLTQALEDVRKALDAFSQLNERTLKHG